MRDWIIFEGAANRNSGGFLWNFSNFLEVKWKLENVTNVTVLIKSYIINHILHKFLGRRKRNTLLYIEVRIEEGKKSIYIYMIYNKE